MCGVVHTWRSEDNSVVLALSFYLYVGSGDWTRVTRLTQKESIFTYWTTSLAQFDSLKDLTVGWFRIPAFISLCYDKSFGGSMLPNPPVASVVGECRYTDSSYGIFLKLTSKLVSKCESVIPWHMCTTNVPLGCAWCGNERVFLQRTGSARHAMFSLLTRFIIKYC